MKYPDGGYDNANITKSLCFGVVGHARRHKTMPTEDSNGSIELKPNQFRILNELALFGGVKSSGMAATARTTVRLRQCAISKPLS